MIFTEHKLISLYPFVFADPTLVDVGSHCGSVSIDFARKGWKIIAFDPEQKNREAFLKNLSGFQNVNCIRKAVSNISGEKVPFYVSDEHYGIHSLKPFHDTHRLAYEVETIRLDDALFELNVQEVTFLKIDIEGADFLALQGFDWQKYHPEVVMIEFMDSRSVPNFGYTHHDVVKYMKQRGYETFVSEWDEIKEYGREGTQSEPHSWLQCVRYPLNHEPVWGNLIFIPETDVDKFSDTLQKYLQTLHSQTAWVWLRKTIRKIPGAKKIYDMLTSR